MGFRVGFKGRVQDSGLMLQGVGLVLGGLLACRHRKALRASGLGFRDEGVGIEEVQAAVLEFPFMSGFPGRKGFRVSHNLPLRATAPSPEV